MSRAITAALVLAWAGFLTWGTLTLQPPQQYQTSQLVTCHTVADAVSCF